MTEEYPSSLDQTLAPKKRISTAPPTRTVHEDEEAEPRTLESPVPEHEDEATTEGAEYHSSIDDVLPRTESGAPNWPVAEEAPLILKFGGSAINDETLPAFAKRVAELVSAGRKVAVVHGGGKAVNALLDRLGVKPNFVDGLRVTDEETLEAVELVLSGQINKRIVRALSAAGVVAAGVSGTDGGLFTAAIHHPEKIDAHGNKKIIDLGRVGSVQVVDTTIVKAMWDSNTVPVVSPLALDVGHQLLNVNADMAASALAGAIKGEMRLLTDVAGVLPEPGAEPIKQLTPIDVAHLAEKGVIKGGMVPKTDSCLSALAAGATLARIQGMDDFLAGSDDAGTAVVPTGEVPDGIVVSKPVEKR